MAFSSKRFRDIMGHFCTGVTVVTAKGPEGLHGLTVNAFTSVSLEPALVLICIQKEGNSHAVIDESPGFVINILSDSQSELANRFADSDLEGEERFEAVGFHTTFGGLPILSGTVGYLVCRTVNRFDGGDHTIFLGEVEEGNVAKGKRPLLFFNRRYGFLK